MIKKEILMKLLNRCDWLIERAGSSRVSVGMHSDNGFLKFTLFNIEDLPNNIVTQTDLERLGIGVAA